MHQEKYNLTWHTFSGHLRDMLHKMMKTNYQTDVTLVCDDNKHFKAHKIVLSACSSVFKSIINNLPQNSSVIYLRGIQHQEMESILEFMYLGVATFYQERMNEFLNFAITLEIEEISKVVEFENENASVCTEEPEILDYKNDSEVESEPHLSNDADSNKKPQGQINSSLQLQKNMEGQFELKI